MIIGTSELADEQALAESTGISAKEASEGLAVLAGGTSDYSNTDWQAEVEGLITDLDRIARELRSFSDNLRKIRQEAFK